jgi:hypothetical protein
MAAPTYFGRVMGSYTVAMDSGLVVRFLVGHRGEDTQKIIAAYLKEHPPYDGARANEVGLSIAWIENLPPRSELCADKPSADTLAIALAREPNLTAEASEPKRRKREGFSKRRLKTVMRREGE